MNTRPIRLIAIVAAVVGCHSGSEPQQLGSLESRITQGEKQSYVAGGPTPDKVIDLVYRDVLTGSVRLTRPPLWQRVLLPPLAYALQAVAVKAQPNSVVCVGEEQTVLIPKVRCVNSDAEGNTRFEFLATTTAGKHQALIQATYGVEETVADTVEITVKADVFASTPAVSWPSRITPAVFTDSVALDKFGNTVPSRLVVVQDAYVEGDTASVQNLHNRYLATGIKVFARTLNDSLGAVGARTIVVDSITGPAFSPALGMYRMTVCGYAQIVTATGVVARRVFQTYRYAPGEGTSGGTFGLLTDYELSQRTTCPS